MSSNAPISARTGSGWEGVEVTSYKNEPGTWMHVTRQVLFSSDASQFEVRFFEVAPGGYTSYERHQHEHCVLILSGRGRVRIGDTWSEICAETLVRIHSGTPHQFAADDGTPMGILCIVDRQRDVPELLGNESPAEALN